MTPWQRTNSHSPAPPRRGPRSRRGGRLDRRRDPRPTSEPQYPALRERLFDGDELRRFVNVYVNNEDIRYLDDLATPVAAHDEVSIIPAVAGG